MLAVLSMTVAVCLLSHHNILFGVHESGPGILGWDGHKLMIPILAFFVVFRANSAYGRFWEGYPQPNTVTHCRWFSSDLTLAPSPLP